MSLRLLPFRQYNEHDVVNLFALEAGDVLADTNTDGSGSNGVIVKVTDGNFDQDPIVYASDSYLGKTDYPFVGGDMYPSNPLNISPAGSGDSPLGVTLLQTAKADENGEKLLYNATKREELQAVLPGQSVPVATKGIFTFSQAALAGATSTSLANKKLLVGNHVHVATGAAEEGKITGVTFAQAGVATGDGGQKIIGTVIGTGTRSSAGDITDQFAGDYVIVKLEL
jgi:hypothetical protein